MGLARAVLISLSCLGLCAGCSFDQGGLGPGQGNPLADAGGGGGDVDAAPPTTCSSDTDCATPPDLCHLPGTCDTAADECRFPEVSCTDLDDACAVGTCDLATGACAAQPANEGVVCDDPEIGQWSRCEFDDTCGVDGEKTRIVAEFRCETGVCAFSAREESASCQRSPEQVAGTACGPESCGGWSDCLTDGAQCSQQGTRSQTCSGWTCSFVGACTSDTWQDVEQCFIDTDGDACWGCGSNGMSHQCECVGGSCVNDG